MEKGIFGLGVARLLSLKLESTGRKAAVTLPLGIGAMYFNVTVVERNALYPRFGSLRLTLKYETKSIHPQ